MYKEHVFRRPPKVALKIDPGLLYRRVLLRNLNKIRGNRVNLRNLQKLKFINFGLYILILFSCFDIITKFYNIFYRVSCYEQTIT